MTNVERPAGPLHVPSLDGLRALAISAVFLFHAFAYHKVYGRWTLVRLGHLGVELFFVLSGFLITLRLLALRGPPAVGARHPRWTTFFLRRVARTFPLYYAALAIFFAVGERFGFGVEPGAGWSYWTYTFNVLCFLKARWVGDGGHFWSLCVEEQFYALFPPLVLTRARRLLVPVAAAAGLGSLASRIALAGATGYVGWALQLIVLHFDTLGAGVIAACAVAGRHGARPAAVQRAIDVAGLVAGVAFVAIALTGPHPEKIDTVLPTFLAVAAASLVMALWEGRLPLVAAVLGARPLVALGRISYGVYVVHVFVIAIVWRYRAAWLPPVALLRGALSFALSIALAALSWHFFERPIVQWVRARTQG